MKQQSPHIPAAVRPGTIRAESIARLTKQLKAILMADGATEQEATRLVAKDHLYPTVRALRRHIRELGHKPLRAPR